VTPLDIYVLDAPILRQETTVLAEVTDAHRRLIDDMFETMHIARGIGYSRRTAQSCGDEVRIRGRDHRPLRSGGA